ncbi:hypothetical protein [Owenweeksia hongkongensis]|uniref:hypothetical protein n=1 Tax=Owenweeksia hongkongensis TaxID=253245 RepID=UPI003A8DAB2E
MKIVFYEDQANDPQTIFDAVDNMDEHYSGFTDSPLQWEDLGNMYSPLINHTSNQDLWNVLTEMLDKLNDEYVKLYDDASKEVFISEMTRLNRLLPSLIWSHCK